MTPDVEQCHVRMRQGRNRPGFAGEAGPYRVVGSGARRDHLDGYVSIETRVSGAKTLRPCRRPPIKLSMR